MAVRPDKNIYQRLGIGDPGARPKDNSTLRFSEANGTIDYSVPSIGGQDAKNLFPITEKNNDSSLLDIPQDLIKFHIEVINSTNPDVGDILAFRAYLDSLSDDYTGGYNSYKYNGRAEKFYTYNEFDRNISFNFKIAAQTLQEMKPLYQKLNYLVAQTAPEYSANGRMRGKFSRLTIGDWISNVPGFFESVGLSWNKNYPWEISLYNENDQHPHVLEVSCKFKPIHDFAPQNSKDTPFILPSIPKEQTTEE